MCGMTVYDYCHLGHARVMVVFDMVYRWLMEGGLDVTYVRNITDIDDKIIKRAAENGEPIGALTQRFIDAMHEDERALGILPPSLEPRATQNIPQILNMIATLDSPWGAGRPGWHIECSAMAQHSLGKHFDIHGGGADLQFPHHENEIAQSEGAQQCRHVNVWMHNGFVRVDNEKMSKSLGNFFTIREVLRAYDAEVVRFFILRAHYRSQLNYSDTHLNDAKQSLARLYTALGSVAAPVEAGPVDWDEPHAQRFRAAMNDDLNTPEAMAVLFDLANEVNRSRSMEIAGVLKALGKVLGLLQWDPDAYLKGRHLDASVQSGVAGGGHMEFTPPGMEKSVQTLITERAAAKHNKNFVESDRIRRELLEAGIVLEDGASGTTWRRA